MSGFRIGGLGSGMDTQMMLEQLMRAERMPLDRMKQQKQVLQWRQEDYRAINTKLLSFRDKAVDMRMPATFTARTITSTRENVVTGTASSNAANGTYTVEVNKVGTKAYAHSAGTLQLSEGKNATSSLTEAFGDTFGLEKDDEGNYKKNEAGEYVFWNAVSEEYEAIDFADLDFKIGNKTFTFGLVPEEPAENTVYLDPGTDTLNSMINKINNSKSGVHMVYDTGQNKVFMSSQHEGVRNILGEESGEAIEARGFLSSNLNFKMGLNEDGEKDLLDGNLRESANYTLGEAAEVRVNGYLLENNSRNNFTFAGVTFTVKEIGTSTITVNSDTNKVMDNIKSFVDEYNSLISSINEKLFETRNRDYPPLTDEQREQLSDREAEKWEEQARAGHLRNDTMLQGVLNNIRSIMGGAIEGLEGISSLSQIGINTREYSERGILHIDETKLRRAIEDNPEGVQRLFAGDGINEGLSQKLRTAATNGINRIGNEAGRSTNITDQSFIGRSIKRIDDRIFAFEDRLQRVEDRYWRQFTAMEKALNEMHNQSDWLYQQLMQF